MNTTNGKIALQSRKMITSALLRLMEQEDYRDITITQIAQEAELSRKTFYRLFTDKEHVLLNLLQEKALRFLELVKERDLHYYWEVMSLLFSFWGEERELVFLLKKQNLLPLMNQVVNAYAFEVFRFVQSPQTVQQTQKNLPYLLAYSIGGMCSMLQKWMEDNMAADPQAFISQLKEGFQSLEL